MKLIYKENPYHNFDGAGLSVDISGWNSDNVFFERILSSCRHEPKLIIEVGSWKGASAIHIGEIIKQKGWQTKILCIDTWLGNLSFWIEKNDPTRFESLQLVNGYPSVYRQFLFNVLSSDMQDIIIPFPQTSLIAFKFLKHNNIEADIIYIDASHEFEDVLLDIRKYYSILCQGGFIFGDDYLWDSVRTAITIFCNKSDLNSRLIVSSPFWAIKKPYM